MWSSRRKRSIQSARYPLSPPRATGHGMRSPSPSRSVQTAGEKGSGPTYRRRSTCRTGPKRCPKGRTPRADRATVRRSRGGLRRTGSATGPSLRRGVRMCNRNPIGAKLLRHDERAATPVLSAPTRTATRISVRSRSSRRSASGFNFSSACHSSNQTRGG
jgi:hypothetical protein